jgi:hypothetical protein
MNSMNKHNVYAACAQPGAQLFRQGRGVVGGVIEDLDLEPVTRGRSVGTAPGCFPARTGRSVPSYLTTRISFLLTNSSIP